MQGLIVVFVLILIFSGFFFIATKILKNLRPTWFSYYGFNKYYPDLGNYTVIFYIAILLLLAIIMAVFAKSSFQSHSA